MSRIHFMSDLQDAIESAAEHHGVDLHTCQLIARAVVIKIGREFSGMNPYIRSPGYDRRAVLRDFSGDNHAAVCVSHGISRATLTRIIRDHIYACRQISMRESDSP